MLLRAHTCFSSLISAWAGLLLLFAISVDIQRSAAQSTHAAPSPTAPSARTGQPAPVQTQKQAQATRRNEASPLAQHVRDLLNQVPPELSAYAQLELSKPERALAISNCRASKPRLAWPRKAPIRSASTASTPSPILARVFSRMPWTRSSIPCRCNRLPSSRCSSSIRPGRARCSQKSSILSCLPGPAVST